MNSEELMRRIDTAADTVEALATEAKAAGHAQAVLSLTIAHGNILAASCFVEGTARMEEAAQDAPIDYTLTEAALNARFGDPRLSRLDRLDGPR